MADLRVFLSTAALLCICACSAAPSPERAAADREVAHMQPMRATYDNTVTGFDVLGTRMDVSIDLNQYSSIDDDAVTALKAEALRRWREAWRAENPGKHAVLTVRFLNYFGKPFLRETTKA